MRRTLAVAAVVLSALAALTAAPVLHSQSLAHATPFPGLACESPGLRSWAVKTLADPNARSLSLTPHTVRVDTLRTRKRPAVYHIGTRLHGVGTTTWRVTAELVGAQVEHDHDIHLVIADPASGGTMVAEFPDLHCWGAATSFAKARMQGARAAILRACGAIGDRYVHLSGRAVLSGAGFFDRFHRHTVPGVAPNAIELHPVLSFSSASCTQG